MRLEEIPGFVLGLGADQDGNTYAAGIYRDTLLLASDTLTAFPLDDPELIGDVFLVSYDADGELRWSQRIGGPRLDVIAGWGDPHGAFTTAADGTTYLGGFFGRGAVFGEGQSGAVTLAEDTYALASFDAEGTLRWVRTNDDLGVGPEAGPWRLAVDDAGHLYADWFMLSASGASTVTVGDTTFTDPGFGGEFVTKITPGGTIAWARQISSDGNEFVSDIAVSAGGQVYVAGYFDGRTLRAEDRVLRKSSLQADRLDGFVVSYDAAGELRWLRHAAGRDFERMIALDTDEAGDVYVAGEFAEVVELGTQTIEARSRIDLFLAKYDARTVTSVDAPEAQRPDQAAIAVYPNPAADEARVTYDVHAPGRVEVAVYDVLGRRRLTVVDGAHAPGTYDTAFSVQDLPSGLYICRVRQAGGQTVRTLVVRH